ncbi:hypothetical protein RHSIM_RhsimUnG0015600 [Rhododendron simsii]|uniref:Uncharacterized protein n=1 Tax=Rhododendron simsii TaxID=118357 RepID=A0A834FZN5_RHOSS|nr:hypothetical protein RHSIM_RhsimUnG0015600 [Rhododendron simsii]
MGKNQQYKAMQRARLGASSTGHDDVEDGMVDGSFHSPEWHAARLASLNTSHTVTWEEYKKKQKLQLEVEFALDVLVYMSLCLSVPLNRQHLVVGCGEGSVTSILLMLRIIYGFVFRRQRCLEAQFGGLEWIERNLKVGIDIIPRRYGHVRVDFSIHTIEFTALVRSVHRRGFRRQNVSKFLSMREEDEMRKGELEADKDKMMREYRAQLDAERAIKLSKGRNHSSSKSSRKKDKEKDMKKRSSKKKKRSRRSSDSSSASSSDESSSSEDEERESRKSKSRSKKRKKERKHRSRSKHSGSDDDETGGGPLPLSRFFGNLKS